MDPTLLSSKNDMTHEGIPVLSTVSYFTMVRIG